MEQPNGDFDTDHPATYDVQVERLRLRQRYHVSYLASIGLVARAFKFLPEPHRQALSTHAMPVRVGRGWPLDPEAESDALLTQFVFTYNADDVPDPPLVVPVVVSETHFGVVMPSREFPEAMEVENAVQDLEFLREIGQLPDLSPDCTYIVRS
jgi:hypothetical protein